MDEQEWEHILQIKTAGRDDSHSDGEHHPYEPTDYAVLERLANSGYIGKKDILIDYGSGKWTDGCVAAACDLRLDRCGGVRNPATRELFLFLQSLCPAHAEAGLREALRCPLPGATADAPLFLLSL